MGFYFDNLIPISENIFKRMLKCEEDGNLRGSNAAACFPQVMLQRERKRNYFGLSSAYLSKFLSLQQEETDSIEEKQDNSQDDNNMADPVRLTAPDVYKDYAVRR